MIFEMAKANDDSQENGQCHQRPGRNIYEGNIDLPSFGTSTFFNMGSDENVRKLLKQIRAGDNVLKPSPPVTCTIADPNETTSMVATPNQIYQTEEEELVCSGGSPAVAVVETTCVPQDGGVEGEVIICLQEENQTYYDPLQFTAGGTRPLIRTSTVDSSQIESDPLILDPDVSDNALFGEGTDNMMGDSPVLEVKAAGYSRFRYQSERNTANKRPRQYEMDEEKRWLAEVEMKNYIGTAKVIVYCVNGYGHLHPYNLFGTDCNNGVFVRRVDFSKKHPVTKLLKVSVTTPKAKEYKQSIDKQRKYLEELNVITDKEVHWKFSDNGDKQVVYLMVKVILEDDSQTMFAKMTKEIRNKKEGTEFRIRTVVPPCAPVKGPCEGNQDKTKVCVIVTDNTAFPKDVCVVLKKTLDDGKTWLRVLKHPYIEVIRKSVVEFVPPPFREPCNTSDVEVELYLQDLKTGQKTEPATFTYKGVDEYGLTGKGLKRKRMESLAQDYNLTLQEGYTQAERRTLQAIRKRTSIGKTPYATSNDQTESSPENSLTIVQTGQATASSHISQAQPMAERAPVEDPEISIEGMRRTRGNSQQPAPPKAVTTAVGTTQMVTSSSYTAQPSYTHMSQPVVAGVKNELLTPAVSTCTEPTFSARQHNAAIPSSLDPELLKHLAPAIQAIAQKENKAPQDVSIAQVLQVVKQAYDKQVGGQRASVSSVPSASTAVPQSLPLQHVINPHVSNQLPKLKPNQMFAVIKGQMVIINDDVNEVPETSNAVLQDIAGQEVLVQKMPVQQPSSESVRARDTMSVNAALQYPTTLSQVTQSYTVQQNPVLYGYQQAPASASLPTMNQSLLANQVLQQPVQIPNQSINQQFSSDGGHGIPWHNYSTNLDDDDIEIDSGATNETDNEKKSKRPKGGEVDTSDKVMEVTGSEIEGSYQNLPKIIADVSEDSEGEEGRKMSETVSDGKDIYTVVLVSSSEDSDDMQS